MVDKVRVIAIGGTIGLLVAGSMAAPAFMTAFADEPAAVAASTFSEMFPKPFNPDDLVKFDITTGAGVSTTVKKSATISKISYGHREYVSIVTTPSGTYSTDALTSPYVRYPGIDVESKDGLEVGFGSFELFGGEGSWTSFTRGSITYFTYSFTPAPRS